MNKQLTRRGALKLLTTVSAIAILPISSEPCGAIADGFPKWSPCELYKGHEAAGIDHKSRNHKTGDNPGWQMWHTAAEGQPQEMHWISSFAAGMDHFDTVDQLMREWYPEEWERMHPHGR